LDWLDSQDRVKKYPGLVHGVQALVLRSYPPSLPWTSCSNFYLKKKMGEKERERERARANFVKKDKNKKKKHKKENENKRIEIFTGATFRLDHPHKSSHFLLAEPAAIS
jgi:hypothetical protein